MGQEKPPRRGKASGGVADPEESTVPKLTALERLLTLVQPDEHGCWRWTGYLKAEGYGQFRMLVEGQSKVVSAHRAAYMLLVGPIPAGLHLDHLCRVRDCVNPKHLDPVTPRTNVLRSPITPAYLNTIKTHCPRGHEYDEENTKRDARGSRFCRTCGRESARGSYARKRAARIATEAA